MPERRPTAVVTGASRGIGKATAIALAESGFDLAITARTVHRGGGAHPGSLDETADAIRATGGAAHLIPMDLLDAARLPQAAASCLAALGVIDVLVNNAIYTSDDAGHRFLDTDPGQIIDRVFGNLTAQLLFMQPVVAAMVDRGQGVVLDVTSAAGYLPPFAPPDDGGWNLSYSVSKGGFHRIAPQLRFEYGNRGLQAFNVQPGLVATERVRALGGAVEKIARSGVSPEVIGAAIAEVARHPDRFDPDRTIQLQEVAVELGLLEQVARFAD